MNNALKGQKYIAQGSDLGKTFRAKRHCVGG